MEASLVCCMHWKEHQKEVRSGGREGTGISEKKDCVFATELWYYASLITYNKTLACYNPFSYFLSVKQWFTKTWSRAAAFSSPPQCPISIILLCLYRECCFLPSDVLQEDTCQVTSAPFHTAVWDLVSRLHLNWSVILGQALDTKLCWESAAAKVCVTLRSGVCPAAGLELQSCFLLSAEDAFTYLGGVLKWFIKVSVASAATSLICFTGVAEGLQTVPPCCGCSAVRYSSPLPGIWGKGSVLTDKVSVNDYVCLHCSVQSWIFLHTWFLGRKVERVKDPVFWFLGYLWDLHNAK